MGNTWKGISDDELAQAEVNILKKAGFKEEDFKTQNVFLDEEPSERYIHHVEILNTKVEEDERAKLPIMVLIHGYGAGGCVFFRVLQDLSEYFHLYVVDMLGMGSSGRPEYVATTANEAEDFFVSSLKEWKEKVGIKEKFYLAGHSLGGYVSAIYSMRYPEEIIKLILLSPVGVPKKPEDFTPEEVVQRFDTWKGKLYARVVLKLWEKNFTPF